MEMNRTRLYFAAAPPLNDLCSVMLTLPSNTASVNSKSQVIRCRELIFTEPEILATPSLRNSPMIQIVMQQSLYKTGRLQARCHKMDIQVAKPRRVNPAELEACLRYTLLAKLAPSWNKVGTYLIQGRDFLTSQQKCNAISIDMNVTERQLRLAISADIVKSVPIQLSDVDICPSVLNGFLNNHDPIREYSIDYKWCHVLPSMKKGQIVNILQQLPNDCPFQSYRDVKRYWKNNYGYRLPEEEIGLMYYQIYFKPIGHTLFTYPSCCIRPRDILVFARTDPQPIVNAFLTDLTSKLPILCGSRLRFASKPSYASSELIEALQVDATPASDLRVNLTQQTPSEMRHWQRVLPASQPNKPTEVKTSSIPPIITHSVATAKKIVPIFKPKPLTLSRPSASKIVPMFQRVSSQAGVVAPPSTGSATVSNENHPPVDRKRPLFCPRPISSQPAMPSIKLAACPKVVPVMAASNKMMPGALSSASVKRKAEVSTGAESVLKKSRPKAQVQPDVDVETLARNNQMHKLNTATVLAWLRDRGVTCKSRDKKSDLTEKVLLLLKLKAPEQ